MGSNPYNLSIKLATDFYHFYKTIVITKKAQMQIQFRPKSILLLKKSTLFIRLNAAAFIKFLAFIQGRRLFRKNRFLKITDNSYCKSFVNT